MSIKLLRSVLVLALAVVPSTAGAQIYESIGIRAQGMSGAFVAVADDATATWWNPAGLASGGLVNVILEFDRVEKVEGTRARAFALAVPSLGLSYYRLTISGMRPASTTDSASANREDQDVLSQYGATVGQSVGANLILASTVKVVRALDNTSFDLDTGAMVMLGSVRIGVAVRNIKASEFGEGDTVFKLPRQARTGVSFRAGSKERVELVAALDADLTTTPTALGDARHLAGGVETWLLNRSLGLRAGLGVNTIGETRRSGSVGASLAFRSGLYADAQLTRGDDLARNGWGFALRLTF